MLVRPGKGAPGSLRERLFRVSKKRFTTVCSWNPFFVDFGSFLGAARDPKMWFSYWQGYDFATLAYLNKNCIFMPKINLFWLRFGVNLGAEIGHVDYQEASITAVHRMFRAFRKVLFRSLRQSGLEKPFRRPRSQGGNQAKSFPSPPPRTPPPL